jgi:hypothetical protein
MVANEDPTESLNQVKPIMKNIHIFQIFYDDATRSLVDKGFTPFDNTINARPDWCEYWSFRSIWEQKRSSLSPSDYLGIFSPRFFEKTGLSSEDVFEAVNSSEQSVISFSPHLHHIAMFNNVFEQGEKWHPGLINAMTATLNYLGVPFDCSATLGTFKNTIFSNYFVARVSVWDDLMTLGEGLFNAAENGPLPLQQLLSQDVPYFRGPVPMKVFVFERMINVLLWHHQLHASLGMNIDRWAELKMITPQLMSRYLTLDALKSQYLSTGQVPYLNQYVVQKNELLQLQVSFS